MRQRHQIYGKDCLGSVFLHAVQISADEWLYTWTDCGTILFGTRKNLISALADQIMRPRKLKQDEPPGNYLTRLESSAKPMYFEHIDLAGNTWLDGKYLAPVDYLPLLVPVEVPADDD